MIAELKAERRALHPRHALRLLRETYAGARPEIAGITRIDAIKHRPGRRLTLRYEVTLRRPDEQVVTRAVLYAKAYRGHRGERVHQLLTALQSLGAGAGAAGIFRVPRPLGYLARRRFLLMSSLPGVTLTKLLPRPRAGERLKTVARALASFHSIRAGEGSGLRINLESLANFDQAAEIDVLHLALDRIASAPLTTDCKERFAVVHAQTRKALAAGTGAIGLIHRDLYPDQILIDGLQAGLIDLDETAWGEPELDVGNFIAHLILKDLQEIGTVVTAGTQAQVLVKAYTRVRSLDADRLGAYTASALLRLSSLERLSQQGRSILDWNRLAAALLHEAEGCMAGTWPFLAPAQSCR